MEVNWHLKPWRSTAGSRTLKWVYEKDGDTSDGDDCGWVDGLYVGPSSGSLPADPEGPGAYAESVDSSLKFTSSGDSTWSNVAGSSWDYYVDGDSAMSGSTSSGEESCLQTIVDSSSSQTLKFWWKTSCQANYDYLEFYIDGQLQTGRITGETEWAQKTYSITSGIHTLKWRYNDGGGSSGDNCGYLDFVQWTGASPVPDSNDWQELDFKHDVLGRRVEKKVDGFSTRYVYDGAHVIAEYDGNNNLLRKYMYGPGIDQPVCMIEAADSNATYYYHYDALGSVIALSDSTGDTVQTYEYSVFGEPAVEDPNHPNPYMFAGRRYDMEIGIYYNRARYYNPYTGRFLQTDPIGYGDGINWYVYCSNNALNYVDPFGLDAEEEEEEYSPYGTDSYKFIQTLVAIAQQYQLSPDRISTLYDSFVCGQAGKEIGDITLREGTREHNWLGGDGKSDYEHPEGWSGFRNVLTQGGQNEEVYRHVGAAAAAVLTNQELLLTLQNRKDRFDLAESRAAYEEVYAKWKNDKDKYQDEKDAAWLAVLEDEASLYGNEAGRLVGRGLMDFINGDINSETLERKLIGILGDDQMRDYFGVSQTRLYINASAPIL